MGMKRRTAPPVGIGNTASTTLAPNSDHLSKSILEYTVRRRKVVNRIAVTGER